jgi:hypothetical protein
MGASGIAASSFNAYTVVAIDRDVVLGLQLSRGEQIEIEAIVGSDVMADSLIVEVPELEHVITYPLPVDTHLTYEQLEVERQIHGLNDAEWMSCQLGDRIMHHPRRSFRSLSAFEALAELSESLSAPVVYFGEAYDILASGEAVSIVTSENAPTFDQSTYVCGPGLSRDAYEALGPNALNLTFADLKVSLSEGVSQDLSGLDHLFALIIGGALADMRERRQILICD